jgi:hypothetical protein
MAGGWSLNESSCGSEEKASNLRATSQVQVRFANRQQVD